MPEAARQHDPPPPASTSPWTRIVPWVVGYRGGTARFDLYGGGDTLLLRRELGQNLAEANERVGGRLGRASLQFEGFTGIVSLGANAQR